MSVRDSSYIVLQANHLNCPAHDAPVLEKRMRPILGLVELVAYIKQGFNLYKIEEILLLDKYNPEVVVNETYEGHSVRRIEIDFGDNNKWFLGPWCIVKSEGTAPVQILAFDSEDCTLDNELISTHLHQWLVRDLVEMKS